MKEQQKIPEEALRLMDFKGYFDVFYEMLAESDDKRHYSVYIKLNGKYNEYFQRSKYSSYESFKAAKTRYTANLSNNR